MKEISNLDSWIRYVQLFWTEILLYSVLFGAVIAIIISCKATRYKIVFGVFVVLLLFYIYRNYTTFVYMIGLALGTGILLALLFYEVTKDYFSDSEKSVKIETNNKLFPIIIKNVFQSVFVGAGSGSGKTEAILTPMLREFKRKDFGGLVYDYKEGDLTRICLGIYPENKVKAICLHSPKHSYRINPINPKYLQDNEFDVEQVVRVLLSNLVGGNNQEENFFVESATGLLVAVILRFKLDYPQYCTLPHVIAFLLGVDLSVKVKIKSHTAHNSYSKLINFLKENSRATLQAGSFLKGLESEKQTAGVMSTLTNLLRKVANPHSFYVLSGNELDINVNKKGKPEIITVLNKAKISDALNPLVATVIHVITNNMQELDRHPSFIMLDEAPTIKLNNMHKIPATMRSYHIALIYCSQDVAQGYTQYGKERFKEIIANLTTQILGKCNEPESAKFYEAYTGIKKVNKLSVTTSDNRGSRTRSTAEEPKYKYDVFMKMKVGRFCVVNNGKAHIYQTKKPSIKRPSLKVIHPKLTEGAIIKNYENIIEEMTTFAEKII